MYKNSFNVPAFLTKLWDMVNDPNTNHLICWTPVSALVYWFSVDLTIHFTCSPGTVLSSSTKQNFGTSCSHCITNTTTWAALFANWTCVSLPVFSKFYLGICTNLCVRTDGFHKVSMVENGTMDSEKDEIQFCHEYFKKDHKELLKNIKRKVCFNLKLIHYWT